MSESTSNNKPLLLAAAAVFLIGGLLTAGTRNATASGDAASVYQKGGARVDQRGQLAYSYSMGMVNASYSSAGGGHWSVAQGGAIRRSTQWGTPAHTDQDIFVLDGQKLVCETDCDVAGSDVTRLYHTENQSFARIEFISPGTADSRWKVTTSDGAVSSYGSALDARSGRAGDFDFVPREDPHPRAWMLSEQYDDRSGKWVRYFYNNDPRNVDLDADDPYTGAYYLEAVVESRDGAQSDGYRATVISYEKMDDPGVGTLSYRTGTKVHHGRVPVSVEVRIGTNGSGQGGALEARYDLGWNTDTPRPMLEDITLVGLDGGSEIETVSFEYGKGARFGDPAPLDAPGPSRTRAHEIEEGYAYIGDTLISDDSMKLTAEDVPVYQEGEFIERKPGDDEEADCSPDGSGTEITVFYNEWYCLLMAGEFKAKGESAVHAEFQDVTGDGLPDRVIGSDLSLHYYRNLGQFSGKEGEDPNVQFSPDSFLDGGLLISSYDSLSSEVSRTRANTYGDILLGHLTYENNSSRPDLSGEYRYELEDSGNFFTSGDVDALPNWDEFKDLVTSVIANPVLVDYEIYDRTQATTMSMYTANRTVSSLMDLDGDGWTDRVIMGSGLSLCVLWHPGADASPNDVGSRYHSEQMTCQNDLGMLGINSSISNDNLSVDANYSRNSFADINGDGLLDLVKRGETYKSFLENAIFEKESVEIMYVHYNTGERDKLFSSPVPVWAGDPTDFPGIESTYDGSHATSVRDVNGDGVADWVTARGKPARGDSSNGLKYWEDNVPKLDAVSEQMDPGVRSNVNWGDGDGFIADSSVRLVGPVGYTEGMNRYADMIDIDGDGILDYVQTVSICEDCLNEIAHYRDNDMWSEHSDYFALRVERVKMPRDAGAVLSGTTYMPDDGYIALDLGKDDSRIVRSELPVRGGYGTETDTSGTEFEGYEHDFIDMNGDGLPDWVSSAHYDLDGDGEPDSVVRLNEGRAKTLIRAIENGRGGRTELEYGAIDPQAQEPGYLPNRLVVKSMTSDNGHGKQSTMRYRYSGGVYDPERREDRGFGRVDTIAPDGTVTETYYEVGDPVLAGRVHRQIQRASVDGPILEMSTTEYENLCAREESDEGNSYHGCGVEQPRPDELPTTAAPTVQVSAVKPVRIDRYRVDGGADTLDSKGRPDGDHVRTAVEFDYDEYGNLVEKDDLGVVDASGDDIGRDRVKTEITYGNDLDEWRFLPTLIEKYDHGDVSIGREQLAYNDDARVETRTVYRQSSDDAGKPGYLDPVGEEYEYDDCGNVTKHTGPKGAATETQYDEQFCDYVVSETLPSVNGRTFETTYSYDDRMRLKSVAGMDGMITTHEYDAFSRRVAEVHPGSDPENEMDDLKTLTDYHDDGQGVTVTGPDGLQQVMYYDGFGNVIQQSEERESGWQHRYVWQYAIGPGGDDSGARIRQSVVRDEFDPDAPTGVDRPGRPPLDAKGVTVNREYVNADGQPTTEIRLPDGTSSITTRVRDKTIAIDNSGTATVTDVDAAENRTVKEVRDENDAVYTFFETIETPGRIERVDGDGNKTVHEFDWLGRRMRSVDPDLGERAYAHDAAGNSVQMTDAAGRVHERSYDALGRLVRETTPDGGVIERHYDVGGATPAECGLDASAFENVSQIGQLTRVEHGAGSESYLYGWHGLPVCQVVEIDGNKWVTARRYDELGRLTGLRYPGDTEWTEYKNDVNGRVETITDRDTGQEILSDIKRDSRDRLEAVAYGNDTETRYSYRELEVDHGITGGYRGVDGSDYQLEQIDYPDIAFDENKWDFTYDDNGNITKMEPSHGGFTGLTRTFDYDFLDRLLEAAPNASNSPLPAEEFVYDERMNLTEKDGVGRSVGGRSSGPHALTTHGSHRFDYDVHGNMQRNMGWSFVYNARNRLKSASPAPAAAHWRFDGGLSPGSSAVISTYAGREPFERYPGQSTVTGHGDDTGVHQQAGVENESECLARCEARSDCTSYTWYGRYGKDGQYGPSCYITTFDYAYSDLLVSDSRNAVAGRHKARHSAMELDGSAHDRVSDDLNDRNGDGLLHNVDRVRGERGSVLAFDEADSSGTRYVELPAERLDGARDFSVSLWLRSPSGQSSDGILSAAGENSDNEFLLYNQSSLAIYLRGRVRNTGVDLTGNAWYHITVTRKGSTVTLYVDGEEAHVWKGAPTGPLSVSDLLLGQEQDCPGECFQTHQAFVGELDDLRIHRHALSATRVADLYVQEAATADWTLQQGAGAMLTNRVTGDRSARHENLSWVETPNGRGLRFGIATTSTETVSVNLSEGTSSQDSTGTGDSVIHLPSETLDGAGDFTVSLQLRPLAPSLTPMSLLSAAHTGDDNALLLYQPSGEDLRVYLGGQVHGTGIELEEGEWHGLTVSRTGDRVRAYVDGAERDIWNGAPTTPLRVDPEGLVLGQEQDCVGGCFQDHQAFAGTMDRITIYRRALTADQVRLASHPRRGPMPRAAWDFDEPDLTRVPDREGGHDARLHLPDSAEPSDYRGSGISGSAFHHSAVDAPADSSGHMKLSAAALDGVEDFTLSLWLADQSGRAGDGILSAAGSNSDNEFLLYDQSSLKLYLQGNAVNTGVNLADDAWHHVLVERSGATVTLYVDGERAHVWEDAPTGALSVAEDSLVLGQEQDCTWASGEGCFQSGQVFRGAIDQVRIHNGTLTAAHRQRLAADPGHTGGMAETAYTYNHDGQRVKKIDADGSVTYYVNKYFEVRDGEPVKHYFAGGNRIASVRDGEYLWFHRDHLQSTSTVTDAAGEQAHQYVYSAYGEPIHLYAGNSAREPAYLYTGMERDATGPYYLTARYYDPGLAVFLRADTVNDPLVMGNRYSYVGGNPVRYRDPSGHMGFAGRAGISFGIGMLVGGGIQIAEEASAGNSLNWDSFGRVGTAAMIGGRPVLQ